MQDSLLGYASIFSNISYDLYRTYDSSALWMTTDGGRTWVDTLHVDHVLSCVYSQPGLLITTRWDNNFFRTDSNDGAYSFDGGRTWKDDFPVNFAQASVGNGIDFSDSLNGVVTALNRDTGMCFWVTTDVGR